MTEKEMLAQYRLSGDMELLGNLYSPYMSLVYGLCYKYLQDMGRSQDAVMNIFEELVVKLRRHEVENFKSWLYRLAKNHCLMELRKTKKNIHIDIEDNMYESEQMLNSLENVGVSESTFGQLSDCLDQLNEKQQQAIRLFHLEKKCYQEIVQLTGYDIKKVKSYIQNGRRNLKLCLENKEDGK